jgi:phenylacetate-CoA ligase
LSAKEQWAEVLRLPFAEIDLPTVPSALAVRVMVGRGNLGIGWNDADGLAEEVHVGSAANPITAYLTLWDPGRCKTLVFRNASPTLLEVSLLGIDWLPLEGALGDEGWAAFLKATDHGYLFNLPFKDTLAEALWRGSQEQSEDDLVRLRRLKRIVALGWDHCPGYRHWWKSNGWHPGDLNSLRDAMEIPVITKDRIRSDVEAFSLRRRSATTVSTSGTTGQPFTFRFTDSLRAAHQAAFAMAASYAMPGRSPAQIRFALIRGQAVRGLSATGPGGSLVFSPALRQSAPVMAQLLAAYKPDGLYGIPSAAADLVTAFPNDFMFEGAVLSSESVSLSQLHGVQRIAKQVVVTYGLSEGAAFALRCSACGAYRESTALSVVTLRPRGDGLLAIVGTSLWALGTLFISYDTGDLTSGAASPCPLCPPGGTCMIDVIGREQDAVLDRDGLPHTVAVVVGGRLVANRMGEMRLFDFVQEEPGRVVLRYSTQDGRPIDEAGLVRAIELRTEGIDFEVRLEPRLDEMRQALPPGKKWKIVKRSPLDS